MILYPSIQTLAYSGKKDPHNSQNNIITVRLQTKNLIFALYRVISYMPDFLNFLISIRLHYSGLNLVFRHVDTTLHPDLFSSPFETGTRVLELGQEF